MNLACNKKQAKRTDKNRKIENNHTISAPELPPIASSSTPLTQPSLQESCTFQQQLCHSSKMPLCICCRLTLNVTQVAHIFQTYRQSFPRPKYSLHFFSFLEPEITFSSLLHRALHPTFYPSNWSEIKQEVRWRST